MMKVLFAAGTDNWEIYKDPLAKAFENHNLGVELSTKLPAAVTDYIIYSPTSDLKNFSPFTNCKAVLSLWAGVEKIVSNETLTQPLCRMVDPGLTQGMVEWVTGHCMRYHLGIDANLASQNGAWSPKTPPLAKDRRIAILGLGELGTACATALAALGFHVSGWSRRKKSIAGITCKSGEDGLFSALGSAEIVVLLLPDTPATENTLNLDTLAALPKGACILNPGRGTLIDDAALLAALDQGHIAHATLDVFRIEPLPKGDPYWSHSKVTVTPHIAAETRPNSASEVIAENIARCESGRSLLHQVDKTAGY